MPAINNAEDAKRKREERIAAAEARDDSGKPRHGQHEWWRGCLEEDGN